MRKLAFWGPYIQLCNFEYFGYFLRELHSWKKPVKKHICVLNQQNTSEILRSVYPNYRNLIFACSLIHRIHIFTIYKIFNISIMVNWIYAFYTIILPYSTVYTFMWNLANICFLFYKQCSLSTSASALFSILPHFQL